MPDTKFNISFGEPPEGTPPPPPIEAVSALLTELSNIDLLQTDVETLKGRLEFLMRGHSSPATYFEEGTAFYRGRVMSTLPTIAADVGPPPDHLLTGYGRINRPGKSVLYTNLTPTGVFKEIHALPGQNVVLASYRAKRRILAMPVGFNNAAVNAKGWQRILPEWTHQRDGRVGYEFNQVVSEFFAHQFLKTVENGESHLYKLSVAWAEMLLGIQGVDAISYPSVANSGISDNMAFKTETYSDVLDLERIDIVRFEFQEETRTTLTFLKKTKDIDPNGLLVFQGADPLMIPDKSRVSTPGSTIDFRLIDGKWVGTAPNGDRIAWETSGSFARWQAKWFGERSPTANDDPGKPSALWKRLHHLLKK